MLNDKGFREQSSSYVDDIPLFIRGVGGRLINSITESQIIRIWQHELLNGARLVAEGSEPIEIVYPGRNNDDQGADFRDAVIATRGKLIKGDIEVHVKSSDWHAHQHHRDPVYNRVVLHVVMWQKQNSYLVVVS